MTLVERKRYIGRCPRCSQCKWVPTPKSQEFATICPSIEYGNFHSYSAGGMGFTAYALAEGKLSITKSLVQNVYTCTMCGACDTACKTNIGDNVEPLETLYELRAHIAESGHLPDGAAALLDTTRQQAQPPSDTSWQEFEKSIGLAAASDPQSDTLLHFGPELVLNSGEWPTLRAIVGQLRKQNIKFRATRETNISCGVLAHDLGDRGLALEIAQRNRSLLLATGCKTVVTFSADAYSAFRNMYPRLDVMLPDIQVLHINDLLQSIEIADVKQQAASQKKPVRVTYHDPCKLGRLGEVYEPWHGSWKMVLNVVHIAEPQKRLQCGTGGNYDPARAVLKSASDVEFVEMERTREYSYCCGAGAGSKSIAPAFANQTADARIKEAQSVGADILVTSCKGCRDHLREAAKRTNTSLTVVDLLEFVAERAQGGPGNV
jgi:Fe-S oxidoreductase